MITIKMQPESYQAMILEIAWLWSFRKMDCDISLTLMRDSLDHLMIECLLLGD